MLNSADGVLLPCPAAPHENHSLDLLLDIRKARKAMAILVSGPVGTRVILACDLRRVDDKNSTADKSVPFKSGGTEIPSRPLSP